MKKYSAILFDFDYTLADSSQGIVLCFRKVLNRHSYINITDDNIKRTIGKTLENSFSILTGINDPDMLAGLKKEYSNEAEIYMTVNTHLFPDTLTVLQKLKEQNMKIGIISTKYRFRILDFFKQYFPENWFDIIVGGEDVTSHKPDPEGINYALKNLHLIPEDVVYVGDSIVDAETALNAKVDFVGVTSGMTSENELMLFPHKKIINRLGELTPILIP